MLAPDQLLAVLLVLWTVLFGSAVASGAGDVPPQNPYDLRIVLTPRERQTLPDYFLRTVASPLYACAAFAALPSNASRHAVMESFRSTMVNTALMLARGDSARAAATLDLFGWPEAPDVAGVCRPPLATSVSATAGNAPVAPATLSAAGTEGAWAPWCATYCATLSLTWPRCRRRGSSPEAPPTLAALRTWAAAYEPMQLARWAGLGVGESCADLRTRLIQRALDSPAWLALFIEHTAELPQIPHVTASEAPLWMARLGALDMMAQLSGAPWLAPE